MAQYLFRPTHNKIKI